MRSPTSPRPKKAKQVKTNVRGMLIIFFVIKGIVLKEFTPAGQRVNSAFYCDCVKMCEDFAPNFGDKRTGCCIMTTSHLTSPLHQRIFNQKQHDCHPPPILLSSVSERSPSDTTEVIVEES
jgi:hypothetical protein